MHIIWIFPTFNVRLFLLDQLILNLKSVIDAHCIGRGTRDEILYAVTITDSPVYQNHFRKIGNVRAIY